MNRAAWSRHSFTLIETVVSAAIVGIMLTAVMSLVGSSRTALAREAWRADARRIAQSFMSQITSRPFMEPNTTGTRRNTLGLDEGESLATPVSLDDVDDFTGMNAPIADVLWAVAGPADTTGAWRVTVAQTYVDVLLPALTSATVTDAKRITVNVLRNNVVLESLVAVRARSVDP